MAPRLLLAFLLGLCLHAESARAAASGVGVDAPELARAGPYAVGVSTLTIVQPSQPDPTAYDPKSPSLPRRDRALLLHVWYPAVAAPGATSVTYAGALTGEDGKDVVFSTPGAAIAEARPVAGSFPLVIMAHGYGGTPVAMSWLAENLASKGYVVVGPHFDDPPITDGAKFTGPLARRPLDIAFVAGRAQALARAGNGVLATADPARTVLIGYSMGGYGVLTAAGGALDPSLAAATHGALASYVAGAPEATSLTVEDVKTVVAISPAGRFGPAGAWGAAGLRGVTAPTLFIVGSEDHIVGYDPGVKTLFGQETRAPRYLLTFDNAGHSIGMNGAPAQMRARLWDLDWWEDPVWRKARVTAIQQHFITAFLDRYVKGDLAKAAFLDVPEPVSDAGSWPDTLAAKYDAYSTGVAPITAWRGFQRAHSAGLELRFAPAGP